MTALTTTALDASIGDVTVCSGLDLQLEPGKVWGMLGRNGVGKSTLLLTLAGLHEPGNGVIELDEKNIGSLTRRQVAQQLGLVLQQDNDPFPGNVMETVLAGRHPHLPPLAWESDRDREMASRALAQMDLADLAMRDVTTLSGGERRRVAIATLLTQDPGVMLLDEPTGFLDLHHQVALMQLLQKLAREESKTVLMVMHDINLASRYCDRLLLLCGDGESVNGTPGDVLTGDNLARAYRHPVQCLSSSAGTIYLPSAD